MTEEQSTEGTVGEGGPTSPARAAGGDPPASPGGQPGQKKQKERRRHWPALLKRFPRLFWHPPEDEAWPGDWPVVPPAALRTYPALAADLAVWGDQLEPRFRRLDHQAQILQNQFWRQRVMLITGGLLATSLATVQAAMGGGIVVLAVLQAVLTGLLAGLAVLIRSRRAQQGYFTSRLKAERIKSEFFLFLARAGGYAGDDRLTRLQQEVDDIEAAESVS